MSGVLGVVGKEEDGVNIVMLKEGVMSVGLAPLLLLFSDHTLLLWQLPPLALPHSFPLPQHVVVDNTVEITVCVHPPLLQQHPKGCSGVGPEVLVEHITTKVIRCGGVVQVITPLVVMMVVAVVVMVPLALWGEEGEERVVKRKRRRCGGTFMFVVHTAVWVGTIIFQPHPLRWWDWDDVMLDQKVLPQV